MLAYAPYTDTMTALNWNVEVVKPTSSTNPLFEQPANEEIQRRLDALQDNTYVPPIALSKFVDFKSTTPYDMGMILPHIVLFLLKETELNKNKYTAPQAPDLLVSRITPDMSLIFISMIVCIHIEGCAYGKILMVECFYHYADAKIHLVLGKVMGDIPADKLHFHYDDQQGAVPAPV